MKAVIFDYNGTLFFDSDINEIAWRQTIEELSQGSIDFNEVYPQYKSVRNYLFIEAMFKKLGKPLNEDEILWWAKRKETRYYHSYCREHHRDQLAPGAADLLDYLKEKKIPINLCTASLIENVNFYFDYLKLGNWFDQDKIAYDDGTFYDKVSMYKAAAKRVGYDISECLVFEDSPGSIAQAIKAGCRNVVVIGKNEVPASKEILAQIDDFRFFDRTILNKE